MYYKIVNKGSGKAVIDIDGEITQWGENSSRNLSAKIKELSKSHKKILMKFNSPGGSVVEGIKIIDAIHASNATIHTQIVGLAASMAAVIAVSGDKVIMSKYGRLMFHQPSGSASGQADDFRQYADALDEYNTSLIDIIADKRGIDAEEIRNKYFKSKKDIFLSPEKALSAGLVDNVVDYSSGKKLPKNFDQFSHDNIVAFYDDSEVIDWSESNHDHKFNKPENNMELGLAIKALGLPEGSSDASVMDAIHKIKNENSELKSKLDTLEKKRKEETKNKLQGLIDKAVEDKKLPASQKAVYEALADSDPTACEEAIAKLTPAKSAGAQANAGTPPSDDEQEERKDWGFEDWYHKDFKGLDTMKTEDPDRYNKLKNAFDKERGQ